MIPTAKLNLKKLTSCMLLLALTVAAGIGYDVDWRKVQALMIDAAKRTENILENPAPFVLKNALGNYAVNYELFVWTNVLDRSGHRCLGLTKYFNWVKIQLTNKSTPGTHLVLKNVASY